MNRVYITGIGTVNPAGNNAAEFNNNLKNGICCLSELVSEDADFPIKVCGRASGFRAEDHFSKKELRRMDRFVQLAVVAAEEALLDSKLDIKEITPFRSGVILGVGFGGLPHTEKEHSAYLERGSKAVSASFIPAMVPNMASAVIAMRTGFKGSDYSVSSACASSTNAIGEAFRKIKDGYLDVCICGGSESTLTGFCLSAFGNMKALTKASDPMRASIPFDANRSGFVLGEGAGILVLESEKHALERGAKLYAEICGYGSSCDAFHVTMPDPSAEAICYAIRSALSEAGLREDDIDYINAHGTSTHFNDLTEAKAIRTVFAERTKDIAVNSTKSVTGHLLGGAGAVECCAVALQMRNGYIHPTCGTETIDSGCDLNVVLHRSIEREIKAALSLSLGFGGHNGVLCLKKLR